jgi:hypothetical protein
MEALVGQKGDLELDPVLDRKPVEGFEDGCDVVVLPHPHQDPGSTILDVLQPLDVLSGDPDEECVAVVQPGGDKGVDKFFGIGESEYGAEFCNVPEVEERGFAEISNVGLKGQVRIHFDTKVID